MSLSGIVLISFSRSNMLAAQERARKDDDLARALQTGRGFRQRKAAVSTERLGCHIRADVITTELLSARRNAR